MLKWENPVEAERARERLNQVFARVSGSRVLYILMILAAFVMLAGASDKWGG
jgi:hypothetical protein